MIKDDEANESNISLSLLNSDWILNDNKNIIDENIDEYIL